MPGRNTVTAKAVAAEARWVDRIALRIRKPRQPSHQELRLVQRNVFVLPTRAGLFFALVLIVMLIASINYVLSLGFALTFLLAAVALLAMLHTFRNLSGLVLRPGRAEPVFAGQPILIGLMLFNPDRLERFSIRVAAAEQIAPQLADLAPRTQQSLQIALPTRQRGLMAMPRLRLSTVYPLGLFRAWAYWHPAIELLVYPAPETGPVPLPDALADDEQPGHGHPGAQDLSALSPYRAGDPISRIDWRAVARNPSGDLLSKQLEAGRSATLALRWEHLPASMSDEAKISRLTRWVLDAEAAGKHWSMHLPGIAIAEDGGATQRDRCLDALARWGSGAQVAKLT